MAQHVALITGGATGIGKETAKILAARGVRIVLTGRRADVGADPVEDVTLDDLKKQVEPVSTGPSTSRRRPCRSRESDRTWKAVTTAVAF